MVSGGSILAAFSGVVLGVGAGVAALVVTTAQPARTVGGQPSVVVTAAAAKTATPNPAPSSPAAVQAASARPHR
ncbi:MAG TPA: hypothetical protein VN193_17660 [Candidatus Angelobacter sp.]|nr:hypothetical protein [Candidatus Angelobacter sp.]